MPPRIPQFDSLLLAPALPLLVRLLEGFDLGRRFVVCALERFIRVQPVNASRQRAFRAFGLLSQADDRQVPCAVADGVTVQRLRADGTLPLFNISRCVTQGGREMRGTRGK